MKKSCENCKHKFEWFSFNHCITNQVCKRKKSNLEDCWEERK